MTQLRTWRSELQAEVMAAQAELDEIAERVGECQAQHIEAAAGLEATKAALLKLPGADLLARPLEHRVTAARDAAAAAAWALASALRDQNAAERQVTALVEAIGQVDAALAPAEVEAAA